MVQCASGMLIWRQLVAEHGWPEEEHREPAGAAAPDCSTRPGLAARQCAAARDCYKTSRLAGRAIAVEILRVRFWDFGLKS